MMTQLFVVHGPGHKRLVINKQVVNRIFVAIQNIGVESEGKNDKYTNRNTSDNATTMTLSTEPDLNT